MKSLSFRSVWAEEHLLFCCLYWWEQSVLCLVSASPCWLSTHNASSWGWGDKGPNSDLCSVALPEVGTLSWSSQPSSGEESLLYRLDGGDFVFFLFLNLYRGFIAVLKYVRSYLHSLSLVTETNKIIYWKMFLVNPLILLFLQIRYELQLTTRWRCNPRVGWNP